MSYTHNVGSLDGAAMIKMNNLAVGYFPIDEPQIGVYPPPVPDQVPIPIEQPMPQTAQEGSKKNF